MQSYNDGDFDMAMFVQDQKEMMNELLLKRSQVQQLRKDLDSADTKIFELTRKLDELNRTKADLEYMSKRVKVLEDKFREQKDTKVLSNTDLVFENKTLKDKLEKAHAENKNLLRTIEDLNVQHQSDMFYRNELMKEDLKIQSEIGRCTETVEKLENDSKFLEMLNAIDLCEKQKNAIEFYKNKNKTLEREKNTLENEFITYKAKLEALENLMESFPLPQKDSLMLYDETSKIIESLRTEVTDQQELVKTFAAKLKAEMEANLQFVERDAANTLEIEDLKQQLAKFNKVIKESSTQTEETEKEVV